MGRKPNPVIAARFTRGRKHGQTTNRYAQTCNHCGAFFPTGRPETLYTHLAKCPGLNEAERAEVINQMFRIASGNGVGPTDMLAAHPQHGSIIGHNDDFDITGLNVLAGAAENAEDLAIDPQITEQNPMGESSISVSQPLTFYDNHYETPFTTATSNNVWSFPFPTIHETTSPAPEVPDATSSASIHDTTTLHSTRWTFEPIITPSFDYITHPVSQTPVVFADQSDDRLEYVGESSSTHYSHASDIGRVKRSRAPYNEPKRARIAAMRQVGACVRCSRLRKPCEPTKPCKACSQTASKTWIGTCTTLNKGQEFDIWFGKHLSQARDARIELCIKDYRLFEDSAGHMELTFLSSNDSRVTFDVVRTHANTDNNREGESSRRDQYWVLIHHKEDITQKLLEYSIANQESIIEAIDEPALYTTVRTVQGLSLGLAKQETDGREHVWGSCKQTDDKLTHLFDLWLITYLLTTITLKPRIAVFDINGYEITEEVSKANYLTIAAQLDAVLETVVFNSKEHLRRFDANILNQTYKYLFNLAVGTFLLLDVVERYCCFVKDQNYPSLDYDAMVDQANSLAHKYSYCVQNIQMIPKPRFDTNLGATMAGQPGTGKLDHELQHIWIKELCISESDLDGHLSGWGDDQWLRPSGRLWARLFVPIIRQ